MKHYTQIITGFGLTTGHNLIDYNSRNTGIAVRAGPSTLGWAAYQMMNHIPSLPDSRSSIAPSKAQVSALIPCYLGVELGNHSQTKHAAIRLDPQDPLRGHHQGKQACEYSSPQKNGSCPMHRTTTRVTDHWWNQPTWLVAPEPVQGSLPSYTVVRFKHKTSCCQHPNPHSCKACGLLSEGDLWPFHFKPWNNCDVF